MVDNALRPHGGRIIERLEDPKAAVDRVRGLKALSVDGRIATECVNIAYGFFSPLDGFMGREDVEAVAREMRLASGYVWSIPVVLDVSQEEIAATGIGTGETVLLTFNGQPLATIDVDHIFPWDREEMARNVYGTTDDKHPGVRRTQGLKDRFLGGKITLVNPPAINSPFDRFWHTPRQLRAQFEARGWQRVVAHQTRNVPHSGHEWMMKGAYLAAEAQGILVSAVIGEKKPGDYIDEAIVLGHDKLRESGFIRPDVHQTSTLMWDMRYAGPREAVFHALVRKNMGCTHHMFGRDHAGVGNYYGTYAAHEIFDQLPDLGIKSVLTLEWWYCPVCESVAYEGLCGHREHKQDLSGTFIRSIIQGGTEPASVSLRGEVLEVVRECADTYGFGSPFVTEAYLENRTPVMSLSALN
jgi:sulfate adenylyltransferase